jgi:hypothetical protein
MAKFRSAVVIGITLTTSWAAGAQEQSRDMFIPKGTAKKNADISEFGESLSSSAAVCSGPKNIPSSNGIAANACKYIATMSVPSRSPTYTALQGAISSMEEG